MLTPEDQATLARIEEEAEVTDRAFRMFREMQTQRDMDADQFTNSKAELRSRLDGLREELDKYLAGEYGVDPKHKDAFRQWQESHQPFHWFVEFYGIMNRGGFDVIIGNPPYVEYSKVRSQYQVQDFDTLPCGNIYALIVERSMHLWDRGGLLGLICPLSLMCTERMAPIRTKVLQNLTWLAGYDIRPSSLFEGTAQRLSILISKKAMSSQTYVAGYRRWSPAERQSLMDLTRYVKANEDKHGLTAIPKISFLIEQNILGKLSGIGLSTLTDKFSHPIYVHRICRYFVKAFDFIPLFISANGEIGKSEDYKEFRYKQECAPAIICLLNSTLFYWFWRSYGDGFHCGYGDVYKMRVTNTIANGSDSAFGRYCQRLMASLKENSSEKRISTKQGPITYQEFYPKLSKPAVDEVDRLLGQHYGFTDEELDFIINYDIKYRLGQDGEDQGEEA